jgi:hypothetical protein
MFVHADYRSVFVIGPVIHLKHILLVGDEGRIPLRRYTPVLLLMRFKGVF